MKKEMQYKAPKIEIIFIGTEDILSVSKDGFEGAEHSFFGGASSPQYFWGAEE